MTQKKLYIETYGCHMNVSDSEVVASVMSDRGFIVTDRYAEADQNPKLISNERKNY